MSGQNLHEPQLGANGAGKSTIWDALCWCLTGKTIRGVFGGAVKNWDSKKCSVSVRVSVDGTDYVVTKTHSPNLLTVTPSIQVNGIEKEVITQEDLDEFFHLDHEKFIYALIVGQFNASFLDLKPTEKLNLFSNIMGLDFWEQCSKDAASQAQADLSAYSTLKAQEGGIQARIKAFEAQEAEIRPKNASFEATRAERITSLEEKDKADHDSVANLIAEVLGKSKIIIKSDAQFKERIEHLSILNKERADLLLEHLGIGNRLSTLKGEKSELTKQFNKWKGLDTCPYCEQQVDIKVIREQKTLITKKLLLHAKAIGGQEAKQEITQDRLKILQETIDILVKNKEDGAAHKEKLSREILLLETGKRNLTQGRLATQKEIARIKGEKNPYQDMLNNCSHEILNATQELTAYEAKIAAKEKDMLGFQFWTKGFKELRLWVVSEALAALEVESNTAITQLGLYDWKLKFQMERETSKKTVSKGFHVLVNSKTLHGEDYVPFEIWSGGETQRLKLGSTIGLSSLIQSYKGVEFNISIWDEPSSFLSEEGIDDLIRYLDNYATTTGKAVYFVDQRSLESPYFKSIITVKKTEKGSEIFEV